MTATAPSNGNDWAQVFAQFHTRHKDKEGKKLKYTTVFNAAMDAFIQCPEVPLLWRVLAWIWRHSWGNNSDYCVDKIGGVPMGQQACADKFGVPKQRIGESVTTLRDFYFLLPSNGHKLYPVDDPAQLASQTEKSQNPKSHGLSGLFRDFCDQWKSQEARDFQELESAEATVARIRKVRLGLFKKWRRARTNPPLKAVTTIQPSVQQAPTPVPGAINRNSSSSSEPLHSDATPTIPKPDFHIQHVAAWQNAGKNGVPTPKQSDQALRKLGSRAEEFLRWITPQKLERVQHPGALPKLVEEFLQTSVAPAGAAGPVCWKCSSSLENGSVDGMCFDCAARIHAGVGANP